MQRLTSNPLNPAGGSLTGSSSTSAYRLSFWACSRCLWVGYCSDSLEGYINLCLASTGYSKFSLILNGSSDCQLPPIYYTRLDISFPIQGQRCGRPLTPSANLGFCAFFIPGPSSFPSSGITITGLYQMVAMMLALGLLE
jgi:hypothetical protein